MSSGTSGNQLQWWISSIHSSSTDGNSLERTTSPFSNVSYDKGLQSGGTSRLRFSPKMPESNLRNIIVSRGQGQDRGGRRLHPEEQHAGGRAGPRGWLTQPDICSLWPSVGRAIWYYQLNRSKFPLTRVQENLWHILCCLKGSVGDSLGLALSERQASATLSAK